MTWLQVLGWALLLTPFVAVVGWSLHEAGWKATLAIVTGCALTIGMITAGTELAWGAPSQEPCVSKAEARYTYPGEFRGQLRHRIGRDVPYTRGIVRGHGATSRQVLEFKTCQPTGAHVFAVRFTKTDWPAERRWQAASWRWAPTPYPEAKARDKTPRCATHDEADRVKKRQKYNVVVRRIADDAWVNYNSATSRDLAACKPRGALRLWWKPGAGHRLTHATYLHCPRRQPCTRERLF